MSDTLAPIAAELDVLSPHSCHLGEGPTYDGASDTAWWFDIVENTLFEHRFASGETLVHPLPFMASQLSFVDDATQMIASETGLHLRDIASGRLTLHTPIEADNAETRSNDGRVHPSGTLWIGTMAKSTAKGAGAIYALHRGALQCLYAGVSIPNAICFSQGGDVAYFTDTAENVLMRVATDPATGLPTAEPTALYDHRGKSGGIDGAIVDAQGIIWNARWGAGVLETLKPDGTAIGRLDMPVSRPTCPVFVGPRLDRLLITSARKGMDETALGAEPLAGATFLASVAATGLREPRLRLA